MSDKFVVPNEFTTNNNNQKIMKYHLKSNYIATINPTKLSSLNIKITNENNENVNTNINNAFVTTTTAVAPSGTTTAITTNPFANIDLNDTIYNGNNEIVGVVTTNVPNVSITFGFGTQVDIGNGEELFLSSFKTGIAVNNATQINFINAITVNNDPTNLFPVGTRVYLGNGKFVGIVSQRSNNSITFGDGTHIYLSNNDQLYNGNPNGTVFQSNSKSNRVILEMVIISR